MYNAILSENIFWWGTNGSVVNLAAITVDRYLKVVHPIWSRKYLRPWLIYSAIAFAWFAGIVSNTVMVLISAEVIDGYGIYKDDLKAIVYTICTSGPFTSSY